MVGGSPAAEALQLTLVEPRHALGYAAAPAGAWRRLTAHGLRAAVIALAFAAGVAAWQRRAVPLQYLGAALVAHDGALPSDIAIVSMASPSAGALDAAKLYRRGVVGEVWVPRWHDEPVDRRVEALGIHAPRPHEIARDILERGGVPASSIVYLDEPVGGLDGEMAVVGAALRRRPTLRPIVLTARTHTARARLLLREIYAPAARARVRSPHSDRFSTTSWWRDRGAVREVALEYAKWIALLTRGATAGR
jgi:hypothetical protein